MDNFTPIGNWADEPLDSPPQENSPKKEQKKRHSSIERYRPHSHGGGGNDSSLNGSHHHHHGSDGGSSQQLRRPLPADNGYEAEEQRRKNNERLASNDLRHKLKHRNNGGAGGGGGGGSNQDLRSRLNARSREPEPPPQGYEEVDEGQEQHAQQRKNRGGNRQNHRRVQGPGAGGTVAERSNRGQNREPRKNAPQANANGLPRPKRNTENFNPSHEPPQMRVLFAPSGLKKYLDYRSYQTRDVLVVNDLYCEQDDLSIYKRLLDEIKRSGVDSERLWQSWHGDSHWIADDKLKWKDACPTFHMVLDRIADYFSMDIKATRLNWYRDSNEWKPFHHDAAAVKPDKAKTQNFTVAVSFGMERDAAFEHAQTKTVISMPQPNGTVYTFGRDVNILWRHGILQLPPDQYRDEGRVSIIAWGWIPMEDVPAS